MNSFEKVNSENYDTMPNTDEDTGKEVISDSIPFLNSACKTMSVHN